MKECSDIEPLPLFLAMPFEIMLLILVGTVFLFGITFFVLIAVDTIRKQLIKMKYGDDYRILVWDEDKDRYQVRYNSLSAVF